MSFQAFNDVLPNGLRVVTIETPHLHSVMCAVYVRVGSRHETAVNNGVSHMLEHLLFRGSKRYPNSVHMNAAVEAVGGNLNAATMRDSSYFYTPCDPSGVAVALDVLGDMVTQPRLVQLETEKRIILEEMLDEVDERGRDIDLDNLTKIAMYGADPLALKIAGTPKSVRGLNRSMVKRHFEKHYVAKNAVVAVGGPVRREEVLRLVKKAFGKMPTGARADEPMPAVLPQKKPLHFVRLDETQVEFRLSFPTRAETHVDTMPILLLRRVLDDGLSSRLPHTIVEKLGLAYSVGATVESLSDVGTFDVEAACAPENARAVMSEVLKTIATLRRGRITPAELTRAKTRFGMHLNFLQDAPGDLCGWFGGIALFREPEPFAEKIAECERVTLDDVKRVAREYLSAEKMVCVAVGPSEAKAPLEHVLKSTRRLLGS